jgi:SAM-dependent methyltransferase
MERLTHRACPVCAADAPRPICVRPDRLMVTACGACAMVYVADVPDEEQLGEFYASYSAAKPGLPVRASGWLRFAPLRPPHAHIEILRRSGGLAGRRLVEFGCYHGAFLRRARDEGATVFGVELDRSALADLAGQGIGAARALESGRTFDIACAFQLIEHLADPGGWIATVADALTPGGRLLLATPNGDEIERVGPTWIGFRVDLEHLNYFGVRSLARLLARSGLYLEQHWESDQPMIAAGRYGRGPIGWVGDALARATALPAFDQGTFTLTALARRS